MYQKCEHYSRGNSISGPNGVFHHSLFHLDWFHILIILTNGACCRRVCTSPVPSTYNDEINPELCDAGLMQM